jgi:hypothetical protein
MRVLLPPTALCRQVMMMGQPEAVIQQAAAEALAAPEVQDDFDIGAEDEAALQVSSLLLLLLLLLLLACIVQVAALVVVHQ